MVEELKERIKKLEKEATVWAVKTEELCSKNEDLERALKQN